MFGRRYFGAAYFGPRYWGDGGNGTPIPPPVVVTDQGGAGNLDWRGVTAPKRRRKKKNEDVIRFSDFESLEARAQALADAAVSASAISDGSVIDSEEDDDELLRQELLLMAATRLLQ